MNILITGGAGFIGSNTALHFSERGHGVIVMDNLLSGSYSNISDLVDQEKVKYYENDIRDSDALHVIFSENVIDVCIHFAALVSVAESTENPKLTEDINVRGMLNLLEFCGKNKIEIFTHASSAAIYGDSEELPKVEHMAPLPKSPYAISKLSGEYYNNFYASIYGFKAINCRFFNVFGPKQNPESQYAAAIPIFIKQALLNEDITIFGDGEQVRDFIFVSDLISAINFLIDNSTKSQDNNTFNIGYGTFISIHELAQLIIDLTGSESKIVYSEKRPGDVKYSYASVERLTGLGWGAQVGFERGLAITADWFRDNLPNDSR
jgi:UDP-glucose 4-epimerase